MTRHLLSTRLALGAVLFVALFERAGVSAQPPGKTDIYVTETVGIRRFRFPVSAMVPFPKGALTDETQTRLVREEAEVPAEFTVGSRWPDGSIRFLIVDLNASPGPGEGEVYHLEYGTGVKSVPLPPAVTVTETGDAIQMGRIKFAKSGNPLMVSSIYGSERIEPGANGIEIGDASGATHDLSSAVAMSVEIVKRGPLSAEIRYSGELPVAGGRNAHFTITFDMPNSKAWVRIATVIDDPDKRVRTLALHTPLLFATRPLSWDFGTEGWTYGALRNATEVVDLTQTVDAHHTAQWNVKLGPAGKEELYAKSTHAGPPMSGWGHIQDGKTALAFAIEKFGSRPGTSNIVVDGAGNLTIRTTPTEAATRHELVVYEHFVSPPVQVSAATSPAAALNPLIAFCGKDRYVSSGVAVPSDWVAPQATASSK